jgi:amidase
MDIADDDILAQQALRLDIARRLDALLADGTVLVLPTVPVSSLRKSASRAAIGAFYEAALAINSIAGHAGLPQLAMPVGQVDGKPASLSFVAARGMDEALLAEAGRWSALLKADGFGA